MTRRGQRFPLTRLQERCSTERLFSHTDRERIPRSVIGDNDFTSTAGCSDDFSRTNSRGAKVVSLNRDARLAKDSHGTAGA